MNIEHYFEILNYTQVNFQDNGD